MGKFSNVAHYQDFSELKKILSASAANTYDIEKIERAYKFAEKAHGDQRRVSGIPYILHPVSVFLYRCRTRYGYRFCLRCITA